MSQFFSRTRVQEHLINVVRNMPLWPVKYQVGLPVTDNPTFVPASIRPESVTCNETNSSFTPSINKTAQRLDQTNWNVLLIAQYPVEVVIETLTKNFAENPPILPRASNLPQITLFLITAQVNHPPTGSASEGTELRLVFAAQVW